MYTHTHTHVQLGYLHGGARHLRNVFLSILDILTLGLLVNIVNRTRLSFPKYYFYFSPFLSLSLHFAWKPRNVYIFSSEDNISTYFEFVRLSLLSVSLNICVTRWIQSWKLISLHPRLSSMRFCSFSEYLVKCTKKLPFFLWRGWHTCAVVCISKCFISIFHSFISVVLHNSMNFSCVHVSWALLSPAHNLIGKMTFNFPEFVSQGKINPNKLFICRFRYSGNPLHNKIEMQQNIDVSKCRKVPFSFFPELREVLWWNRIRF